MSIIQVLKWTSANTAYEDDYASPYEVEMQKQTGNGKLWLENSEKPIKVRRKSVKR